MKSGGKNNSITTSILKAVAITATIIALLLGVVYMIMAIDGTKKDKDEEKQSQAEPQKQTEAVQDEGRVIDGVYHPAQGDFQIDDETGIAYVNNIIIVYFNDGTTKEEREKSVKSVDGDIVASDEFIDMYIVKVKQQSLPELKQICEKLNKQDCVDEAMCDYGARVTLDMIPDDPWDSRSFWDKFWSRPDWGDLIKQHWDENDPKGNNWWAEAIDAPSAWDHDLDPITIGMLDADIDTEHEDLKGVITSSQNPTGPEKGHEGHGTHVAGIIGAKANNGKGITGIVKNCSIIASGYLQYIVSIVGGEEYWESYSVIESTTSQLIQGGAKVVNLSLGALVEHGKEDEAYQKIDEWGLHASKPLVELRERGKDFVIVQSAGNGDSEGMSIDAVLNGLYCSITPENCAVSDKVSSADIINRIIVVGNAKNTGGATFKQAFDSNAGPRVDICAPGTKIYSCVPGGYDYRGGTSMAAPMVTGVAALVWAADSSLSGDEVKEIVCAERNTKYEVADNTDEKHPLTDTYRMVNANMALEDALGLTDRGEEEVIDYDDYVYIDDDWDRKVVLVLDVSGSMDGKPLKETKRAAKKFVRQMDMIEAEVGIVEYSDYATVLSNFTRNQDVLMDAIDNLEPYDMTNIEDGLYMADEMLNEENADKKIIVLMSDGQPNEGLVDEDLIEYANAIKSEGDYIYTLGFFSDVEDLWKAQYLMEQIATPGFHYEVDDADNLRFFFGDLAEQIKGAKYIYIRVACPVDVTITDGKETISTAEDNYNLRAKFGNISFESNESGDDTKVLRLREGDSYDIQISGYDSGYMDYLVQYMDDEGEYTDVRSFYGIEINENTIIDTVADNVGKTRLKVDEDGDGRYDMIYAARKNETGELEKNYWIPFLFALCGLSVVIVLIYIFRRKILYATGIKRKSVRRAGGRK